MTFYEIVEPGYRFLPGVLDRQARYYYDFSRDCKTSHSLRILEPADPITEGDREFGIDLRIVIINEEGTRFPAGTSGR